MECDCTDCLELRDICAQSDDAGPHAEYVPPPTHVDAADCGCPECWWQRHIAERQAEAEAYWREERAG